MHAISLQLRLFLRRPAPPNNKRRRSGIRLRFDPLQVERNARYLVCFLVLDHLGPLPCRCRPTWVFSLSLQTARRIFESYPTENETTALSSRVPAPLPRLRFPPLQRNLWFLDLPLSILKQ